MGADLLGGAGVTSQVELHLAGTFGVVRDGVRLADGGLRSRKARTLLKLLAVEPARLVSVDRITEVLWDGDPPAEPAQHVATLVSRLRRILGPEVIRGGRQGYQLAGSQAIMIDLDEAARLTSHAERELGTAPAVAGTAAERAVEILSPGTALAEEPDAAWAEPARGELRGLLRRARHALAEAAQATGGADLAARSSSRRSCRWRQATGTRPLRRSRRPSRSTGAAATRIGPHRTSPIWAGWPGSAAGTARPSRSGAGRCA